MTNQRADIWSGIMALGTLGMTLVPNTSIFHIPLILVTTVSLGMLVWIVSKDQKKAQQQEVSNEQNC